MCRRRWRRFGVQSYQDYAWPRALGVAFTRHNLLTGIALAATFSAILALTARTLSPTDRTADFYAVVLAQCDGRPVWRRFSVRRRRHGRRRDQIPPRRAAKRSRSARGLTRGQTRGQTPVLFRDILTLRHLHASGADCVSAEEHRTPWRRWLHHCTFYGFLLCFASTTVAAIYDNVFGWRAPYDYASLPVILGTIGGVGLLVGSLGTLDSAPPARPRAHRRDAGRAGRIVSRAAVPHHPDRARAARPASRAGDAVAARRPSRHRARALRHAAVRQVRPRPVSGCSAVDCALESAACASC